MCSCPILPVSALCWNQGAHAFAPMSSRYCQPRPPSLYLLTLLQILLCDSLLMSLHVVGVRLPAFLPKANILGLFFSSLTHFSKYKRSPVSEC